jgi:flagellar hook-basal body complex protein FliE
VDPRIDALVSQNPEAISDSRERRIEINGQKDGPSFTSELGKAIGEVNSLQLQADEQATAVARGAGNLHEMTIALEKADVAMRLAMRVRNKLVETYNDIMRMGI